ncbi:MAG: mannose-6-phosphate isomerase [Bacteroidetes bacterium GWF2_42_66]|nr:MAG: mannose-6-phosphate isomerase [Bacteroidetes bacterium GWA2_42_15]OFY01464.1 MAG: mannose-6-phosphate isomerase [Bacteroidetes bacterium GWE2_42_39]OFY43355.1 MAG: mannose-6-phosphate isomerase [Bacteroidetes bacterium GWF2_42_66]HBL77462.1 mannose-6-phosphate isomerase [Prolixibacteraceae bacterium]HCR91820.1 mannose-6-phosphate isomerase [Prolixibacteraceae bacterium]
MEKSYLKRSSKFNNFPVVEIKTEGWKVENEWEAICARLNKEISLIKGKKKRVVIETYQGVIHEELITNLKNGLDHTHFIHAEEYMLPEDEIKKLVFPDVTNDRIFGFLTRLTMGAFFDTEKVKTIQNKIGAVEEGIIVIYGSGAALLCPEPDLLVYADMARWEIQLRMRQHLVDNLGVKNRETADWMLLYKQGFFVDWRVCDRLKKQLFDQWDFVLDTNKAGRPKLVEGKAVLEGLKIASQRPFSVVPFFDPGPWGGQWMKEVCNLDPESPNYAWCFNCVPEENSLLLKFGEDVVEIPSVNLVFRHPRELLGDPVHGRFGDEFPIRFDFLDTMQGGHLSLQVHPLTEYIQEKFGMHYTQDESYYMMDAEDDAIVYLGLKEGVCPTDMMRELEEAQAGGPSFDAEKHVQTWPVKKHDHVLIPAGTVHCSGKNSMVLEISATPYIFTFKLWDWGRLGMDGKPRPINIEHGKNVIQWDRTTEWTRNNLVSRIEKIAEGDGWLEERTGLHEREFIETRRHWFTKKTEHHTRGGVHVICLVEGDEVIVESPSSAFDPFVVHYAEVFIVPASVGEYTIRPYGAGAGQKCATLRGLVRF